MKLASIDIGTNSMRLLITDYNQSFQSREKYVDITRIGKGVDSRGYLSEEAMEQNLKALAKFVDQARQEDCQEIYIMGTSALRDSKNKEDFLTRAKHRTGLPVDIITGEEEALLGFYGVAADLKESGNVLILDIGGGSTEFILGDKEKGILFTKSENIGAVRLTEKFIQNDPPTDQEIKAMEDYIAKVTQHTLQILKTYPITKLLGIGGTATTLSAMIQELDPYDSDKVHQSLLLKEEIDAVYRQTLTKTLTERMILPGLQPQRADVIIAGMTILRVLMDRLQMTEILISEYDNLEGLIYRNWEK